jgi:DNA-binding CsgD family transcriptional regulator
VSIQVMPDIPRGEGAEELFAALTTSESPALASNAGGRVVFWNLAAERALNRTAAESLGHRCHDFLAARDVFGNRFCQESCAVLSMARRGEPVRGFEILAGGRPPEDKAFHVTILKVSGQGPEDFLLVHILEPIDRASRLARALERLGAETEPQAFGSAANRPARSKELTKREREILRRAATGLQNKEIAERLGISVATVRNHIHNVLKKLGVHSKLEAVSLAFRYGWFGPRGSDPPAGDEPVGPSAARR